MHHMVERFNVDRVYANSHAILTHWDDHVAHANGSLVRGFQKMTGCNRLGTYFVVHRSLASPRLEHGGLRDRFGAVKNWISIENERSMNDLVVLDVHYRSAYLF